MLVRFGERIAHFERGIHNKIVLYQQWNIPSAWKA